MTDLIKNIRAVQFSRTDHDDTSPTFGKTIDKGFAIQVRNEDGTWADVDVVVEHNGKIVPHAGNG